MIVDYFYIWFLALAFSYLIILFGYLYFSEKKNLLNNFLGFAALFFVFINILLFLLLILQVPKLQNVSLPLFTFAFLLPLFIIGIITLISTILANIFKKITKEKRIINQELKKQKLSNHFSKRKKDFFRKINHVAIFIGLFVVWYLSYSFVRNFITNKQKDKKVKIDPKTTNMFYLYQRLLTKPKSIEQVLFSLEWFYYVLFFFFYIFCLIMLVNEFTRKTPHFAFPFNFIPKIFLIFSEEEKEMYCSYLYFSIGQMFASFICPPMAFFAILGMSSIADLMSSQIGITYGKRHLSWNEDKTYEGSLAGFVTSFVISVFFVGPFYACIFSFSFFIFDILTTKPINISDNLLIPIGCAMIFVLVRYITDLEYSSIILSFF